MRWTVAAGLFLALAACGGDDSQKARERCLYAAVSAYPGWTSDAPILDSIPECKALPDSDKAELRKRFDALIRSAVDRMEG